MKRIKYIVLALAAILAQEAFGASQRSQHVSALAPYSVPENKAPRPDIAFMPDGTSYAERSADNKKIVIKDIATGKETEIGRASCRERVSINV